MDELTTMKKLVSEYAKTIRLKLYKADSVVANTNPSDYEEAFTTLRKELIALATRMEDASE